MKLTPKNKNSKIIFWKTNIALALLGCLSEGHSMMRSPCTGYTESWSDSEEKLIRPPSLETQGAFASFQPFFSPLPVIDSNSELDADELYNLGVQHDNGRGVPKDFEKALYYYTLSAKKGNADAQFNAGCMYKKGQGTKQNYEKALYYYTLAARQLHTRALVNLASLYYEGQGVKQNHEMAFKYNELSAAQGNAEAQCMLGEMYNNGYGVKQDYGMAFKYLNLSAKKEQPRAQYRLGFMYYHGQGIEQNYGEAFKYFNLSAAQGNADAHSYLGYIHYYGKGFKQNYGEAFKYYNFAAAQGKIDAQYHLGRMYEKGHGIKKNYQTALDYYHSAAAQGDVGAQHNLGCMYFKGNGKGIKPNYGEAFKYYYLAAAQGGVIAQYNIGHMYYSGYGIEQDYQKALEYFHLAAETGHAEAKLIIIEIEKIIEDSKITSLGTLETVIMPDVTEDIDPISDKLTPPSKENIEIKKNTLQEKKRKKILGIKLPFSHPKKVLDPKKNKVDQGVQIPEESQSVMESEQTNLSEMSERSESTLSKKLRIKKPSKSQWHDTTDKSGKEKKAQKKENAAKRRSMIVPQFLQDISSVSHSERSHVSKSERSGVEKSVAEEDFKKLVEAKLAEGHFDELADCFGRDIKNLSQVVLTEDAIFETLVKQKKIGVINYSGKQSSIKKGKIHATFKSRDANPPAFTAHIHDHNLPWYEQKNVRDEFLGFIAACGLDPIKLIQANQQAKPIMIIPVKTGNEADGAKSEGEAD